MTMANPRPFTLPRLLAANPVAQPGDVPGPPPAASMGGANVPGGVPSKWLIGYAGTWLILAMLSENSTTSGFASALAVAIAIGATFVLLEPTARNFGFAKG